MENTGNHQHENLASHRNKIDVANEWLWEFPDKVHGLILVHVNMVHRHGQQGMRLGKGVRQGLTDPNILHSLTSN